MTRAKILRMADPRLTSHLVILLLGATLVAGCRQGTAAGGTSPLTDVVERYEAPNAEFRLELLPGGLQLTLGPGTRAELHPKVKRESRLLTVTGQARLTLAGDSGVSYQVQVGDAAIRFRQAEITVRRHSSDTVAEIAIASGSASLTVGTREASLKSRDLVRISGADRIEILQVDSIDKLFEWTLGTLHYTEARFEDIIPELERAFDIDLIADERKVLDQRITASFHMGSSSVLLGELAPLLDITYDIEGQTVKLKHDPRPGRPKAPPKHGHTS